MKYNEKNLLSELKELRDKEAKMIRAIRLSEDIITSISADDYHSLSLCIARACALAGEVDRNKNREIHDTISRIANAARDKRSELMREKKGVING